MFAIVVVSPMIREAHFRFAAAIPVTPPSSTNTSPSFLDDVYDKKEKGDTPMTPQGKDGSLLCMLMQAE